MKVHCGKDQALQAMWQRMFSSRGDLAAIAPAIIEVDDSDMVSDEKASHDLDAVLDGFVASSYQDQA